MNKLPGARFWLPMHPVGAQHKTLRIDNGGFAFSLISWLCISQSGHNIYQIKAEYLSYRMITVIVLLVKEFKIYVLKRTKIGIFPIIFFNVESLFNI